MVPYPPSCTPSTIKFTPILACMMAKEKMFRLGKQWLTQEETIALMEQLKRMARLHFSHTMRGYRLSLDDVVQDTLLDMIRYAHRFKGDATPNRMGAWAFRIMQNTIRGRIKVSNRKPVKVMGDMIDTLPAEEEKKPLQGIPIHHSFSRIIEGYRALPERDRRVLQMVAREKEGRDIAREFGRTHLNPVHERVTGSRMVHQALKKLIARLKAQGYTKEALIVESYGESRTIIHPKSVLQHLRGARQRMRRPLK